MIFVKRILRTIIILGKYILITHIPLVHTYFEKKITTTFFIFNKISV